MNHAQQKPIKRFVLTMRNEKGQVGIFVALIFQVIFVFFAMLVNVGLVVHHKINLQQSTDLAAYYGAMKQAEIMNVMAHVNYQMRQAWKLLTWRYRILGTFGLEKDLGKPDTQIEFPVQWPAPTGSVNVPKYNPASTGFSCPATTYPKAAGVTITDIPFMCLGHNGFGDWISAADGTGSKETFCKFTCKTLNDIDSAAFSITQIPEVNTSGIFGNNLGRPINDAIKQANDIVQATCEKMGPITTQTLALFYANYIKDTANRRQFFYMLAKNLGLNESEMVDIEGNKVLVGVENTLKNNLTEANLSSLKTTSIETLNGAKSFGGGTSWAEGMVREIGFERLMFFLVDCAWSGGASVKVKSIYDAGGSALEPGLKQNLLKFMAGDASRVTEVENIFLRNGLRTNVIGYEKNPWIQVYYGVKATSEPKIPFLPLAKIKLHAISFAKPFGGSIGPWYFKNWESAVDDNQGRTDWENRTDKNLPRRNIASLPSPVTLKNVREFIPNYSTHVDDKYSNDSATADVDNKGGLANTHIVAFYHSLLANKYGVGESAFSKNKQREDKMGEFTKPLKWPKYADWYHLNKEVNEAEFDPLAVDRTIPSTPKNSYMRDIELTVVAPNQFDATYYSIEPDFTANYLKKMRDGGTIAKMATATGTSPAPVEPLDFGNRKDVPIEGIPKDFSVRHQLEVTKKLFKDDASILTLNSAPAIPTTALDILATKQSSLLTGWTFLNLTATGYSSFPGPEAGRPYSMLFGTCDNDSTLNPWTDNFEAPYDTNPDLPPVPGNCVTGGRTGYSVKLISSDMLRSSRLFENVGGPGMNGQFKNPVPESFLQF